MKTTAQEHKDRRIANLRRVRTNALKAARYAREDAANPTKCPTPELAAYALRRAAEYEAEAAEADAAIAGEIAS